MGKRETGKPVRPATRMPTDMNFDSATDKDRANPPAALEPGLQAYIGQQLRTVYDEVLNEAIPDRLLSLLQELERKQADKS